MQHALHIITEEIDPVEAMIDAACFTENDMDSATSQYCGSFAFALHRILNRRNIPNQLVLVSVAKDGEPLKSKIDDVPMWRHVAVKIGDGYYDIHGKNTAQDLFDNYLFGYTDKDGVPTMLEVTTTQLRDVLRLTGHSHSPRYHAAWGAKLRGV